MKGEKMNKEKHDVNLSGRVGYGLCNFGVMIIQTIVGAFVTMYYTDNVLLSAGFVGTVLLAVRVLDGITDLAMGAIIDRTHTRIGKARPWVFVGAILFSVSMYLIFNIPAGLSGNAAKVYFVATYFLNTAIFGTIVNVSWSTLAVKMSRNPNTRATMVNMAQLFSNIAGLIAGSYAITMVMYFGGYETGYRGMTLVFGGLAMISMLATGFLCKEYAVEEGAVEIVEEQKKEEKKPAKELLGYMFKNRYMVPLILAFVLNWFALTLISSSMVYYARDILQNVNQMSLLNNAKSILAIIMLLIGIVPFCARKLGKKYTLFFAMGAHIAGGVLCTILGTNLIALVVAQFLRSVGSAFGSTLLMAMVSDVADYINMKNNIDISGMTSSVVSFGMKVGSGLGSAAIAWALAIGGYSAEAANAGLAQSASTIFAEKACFIYIPLICFIILLFLCTYLDVDKKLIALRSGQAEK